MKNSCRSSRKRTFIDLFVDDEEIEDLLLALEGELHQRRFGDAAYADRITGLPGLADAAAERTILLYPVDPER